MNLLIWQYQTPELFVKLSSNSAMSRSVLLSLAHTQDLHFGLTACENDQKESRRGQRDMPKATTVMKENRYWIHSADYEITRDASTNNGPLSLDLDVFVQNHTKALCSQTALETAVMFIQIPKKNSIMVTLVSSLKEERIHTKEW